MATSRVLEVINGLHAAFTAAPALTGVRVSRSWEILPTGDLEHVFVAGDGGAGLGNEDVAVSDIEWPGLGPNARTEDGVIDCATSVFTGDQSAVSDTITRAYALVGACEDVLRTDPSLGSSVALQAKINGTRLRVVQDGQGFAAIVVFTVAFQTSV